MEDKRGVERIAPFALGAAAVGTSILVGVEWKKGNFLAPGAYTMFGTVAFSVLYYVFRRYATSPPAQNGDANAEPWSSARSSVGEALYIPNVYADAPGVLRWMDLAAALSVAIGVVVALSKGVPKQDASSGWWLDPWLDIVWSVCVLLLLVVLATKLPASAVTGVAAIAAFGFSLLLALQRVGGSKFFVFGTMVVPALALIALQFKLPEFTKNALVTNFLGVGTILFYILLLVFIYLFNPKQLASADGKQDANVWLVPILLLFAVAGVAMNLNVVHLPWMQYFSRMGVFIAALLSGGFALQALLNIMFQHNGEKSTVAGIEIAIVLGAILLVAVTYYRARGKSSDQSRAQYLRYFWGYVYCKVVDALTALGSNKNVLIILLVEAALIAWYALAPKLFRKIEEGSDGAQLLNEPVKLNKTAVIPIPSGKFSANYAASCWLFLVPVSKDHDPDASTFVRIFDYNGCPELLYNAAENKLRVTVVQPGKPATLVADIPHVPLQRWHHLVLAYNFGTFDIFINGALYRSVTGIVVNPPPVVTDCSGSDCPDTAVVTVGATQGNKKNRLCNFVFFQGETAPDMNFNNSVNSISAAKVTDIYNRFANKSPPVVSRILPLPDNNLNGAEVLHPSYLNIRL
jgi:hypothetical protein